MVCAIVYTDDRPVSFRHGMLHRGRGRARVTLERRPLLDGEYLLLTLPQTAMQRSEKRCLKKARRLLRDTPATALCWSGQTGVMAPMLLEGLLQDSSYATATPRDYAPIYRLPMLIRAASLCDVPIRRRRISIVDRSGSQCDMELLLNAARLAGELQLCTREKSPLIGLAEHLYDETGLSPRLCTQERAEGDLILLLDADQEYTVRGRIVLDFSQKPAKIAQGRVFTTTSIHLSAALRAQLPPSFSSLESATLLYLALGAQGMESFRPCQLM